MTIQQAFEIGLQQHRSGRLAEAEAIYRRILESEPRHADSLHMLAVIAHQMNRNDVAQELVQQAIANNPQYAAAYDTLGTVLKAGGRLNEAMAAHRQAIALTPGYPEAHYNLGNCLFAERCLEEAIQSYRRCIALKPGYFQAHGNLGNALKDNGQVSEAIAAYRHVIELKPDHPESHYNLGVALKADGQSEESISAFRRAIALKPNFPEAHNNLGVALNEAGETDRAIDVFRKAIALMPANLEAYTNLGNTLAEKGQLDEAIVVLGKMIALNPNYAEGHYNLGIALKTRGQLDEAIAAYRRAIDLKPDLAEAHNNLGIALSDQGQLDAALTCYRRAIGLRANYPEAFGNIGTARYRQGQVEEAIAAYEQAIVLKPTSWGANCNLVSTLHAHPSLDALAIRAAHERWNQRYAEPLKAGNFPHSNDRSHDRRLRIGYVSPDFRNHSVANFIESVLASHDADRFEIFCYSSVICPDAVTARLRGLVSHWREIVGLKDPEVADLVRKDCIDILVDLAGHTAQNRLLVFARKPAPVQVTWLGYPDTTGMDTMDYRLTDAFADPPGTTEHLYTERLIRLPDCAWCFRPATDAPPVSPMPGLSTNGVTFGCFNAQHKTNPPLLKSWSDILHAVPGSRLLLKNDSLNDPSTRERMRSLFLNSGIASDRIELAGRVPILRDHLAIYGRIDIALDTFPYHGTTTTCEALWMGVPVVSRAGKTHVSRVGVSLLSNAGLPELVASDEKQYVRIATELAGNVARLANLRAGMRARVASSVLLDAPRFSRNLEAAYREMWRKWRV